MSVQQYWLVDPEPAESAVLYALPSAMRPSTHDVMVHLVIPLRAQPLTQCSAGQGNSRCSLSLAAHDSPISPLTLSQFSSEDLPTGSVQARRLDWFEDTSRKNITPATRQDGATTYRHFLKDAAILKRCLVSDGRLPIRLKFYIRVNGIGFRKRENLIPRLLISKMSKNSWNDVEELAHCRRCSKRESSK